MVSFFYVNGDHDESMMFLLNMVLKKNPIFLQLFLHRICIIMETCRNLGKEQEMASTFTSKKQLTIYHQSYVEANT